MSQMKRGILKRLVPNIALAMVFVATFVVFHFLFEKTESGSYYQNYLSAIVGSVIIVIVTWILLAQQSNQDELRETNVEVFRRKVLKIEEVTKLLLKSLEDGRLDDNEARLLHQAVHELALFCSNRTLKKTAKFLRQEVLQDVPQDERLELLELVLQYREELNLGKASTDMDQFRLLTAVLSGLSEQRQHLSNTRTVMESLQRRFKKALGKDDSSWEVRDCRGSGDTIKFNFRYGETEEYWSFCEIQYTSSPQDSTSVTMRFSTENLYAIRDGTQQRISNALVDLGFVPDSVSEDEIPEIHAMSAKIPLEPGDARDLAIKEAAKRLAEAAVNGRVTAAAAYSSKV